MLPKTASVTARITACVIAGLAMATFFTVIAAIPFLLDAAGFVSQYGSFIGVAGLYYPGGVIGGVVVATAWPLTRWQDGAAVVGALGALPVYLGAVFLLGQIHDPVFVVVGLGLAGVVGGKIGYDTWEQP